MYQTDYASVVRVFAVTDQEKYAFCPGEKEKFNKSLEFALRSAFKDFNVRTLDKVEVTAIPKDDQGKNQTVTDYLVQCLRQAGCLERFQQWFQTENPDRDGFDDWHFKTCQLFLSAIADTQQYTTVCYGKAQKIVNMMCKHLYCLKGAGEWEAHFRYCHVTLDDFTLEWFKRDVPPYQRIESWSNLIYEEQPKGIGDYLFYQTHIREFFENKDASFRYAGLTPFQAEFYIWREIQLHRAAESFVFELDAQRYKGLKQDAQQRKRKVENLSIDKMIAKVELAIARYRGIDRGLEDSREVREFGYRIVDCPVCGERTLDGHWICSCCGWEYDGVTEENAYSTCNQATPAVFRKK